MKPSLLIVTATALLLAGCVQPESNPPPTETTPTSPEPGANETVAPAAAAVDASVDVSNVTKSESTTLFLNTTGPVAVVVRADGNETLRETINASTLLTVPLAYGQNEITVEVGPESLFRFDIVRLGLTTVALDYGVFHPSSNGLPRTESFEVWIDVDARPSAPAYAAEGATNLDAFTAHDQLMVFEETTGKKVVYEYFASFQGFSVSRIDGAGSAVSSGAPPWWCYTVNGGSADGISIQPIQPGDVAAWKLGSCM